MICIDLRRVWSWSYSKVLDEDKGVRFNSVILNNIWIETGLGFL